MKTVRYLTFEVNEDCNMASIHPRCPVSDPERYSFGDTRAKLFDRDIIAFYLWCCDRGFRGTILFHLYNEPTLALKRIESLMETILRIAPEQGFHLWTNSAAALRLVGFNHIQLTNYASVRPTDLDNRRASTRGEGKPYAEAPRSGSCTRGYGHEVIIDYHGNWLLCCNDWRCEESAGNILDGELWDAIFERYKTKAQNLSWNDKASYEALPRMCRSCIDVNPNLHQTGQGPLES